MIIDGRLLAEQILDILIVRVHELIKRHTIIPHLAVIRTDTDPAITSYIKQKQNMAKKIGALVSVYHFPAEATNEMVLESLDFLQSKGDVHGIIVQLPFPPHSKLHASTLIDAIDPDKDVDGFHPKTKFVVPLAAAVMHILQYVYRQEKNALHPNLVLLENDIPLFPSLSGKDDTNEGFGLWLKTKTIVVIGKGKTGGQPIIDLLRKQEYNPLIIDSTTLNAEQIKESADIIISAVGKQNIITKSNIKKDVPAGRHGAILIGIGMNRGVDGKFYGDYDIEDIKTTASYYTPIPGGVGPVNVAKLMENLVIAAENSVKN